MRHAITLLVTMSALLVVFGCSSAGTSKEKSTAIYKLTPNREARMRAIVDELKSRGYSEERAKRIAAKQVPLMQKTSSESLKSVLTGGAAKRQKEEQQFKDDLEELAKSRE